MQQNADTAALGTLHRSESSPHIAYRVREGSGGEPVLLLHGVGSASPTWWRLAAELDDSLTLVMPDYRGHGESDVPEPPYVVEQFVGDAVRLLDELGLDRVHVVGFSIGALFGQALATRHPERVRSLVLLNSIGGRSPAERERALERLEVIRSGHPEEIARDSAERWFTPAFRDARPDVVASEVDLVSRTDHVGYAATYEVLATSDLIGEASALTCPVLLVTGENDRGSTPRMTAAIHERVPTSRAVVIEGQQHYLHLEVPEQIGSLIDDFIQSQ
jgi:pimeloyl-ACP methyl ester carboxylesterase